ncbi:GL15468 [Drosophila persimilis]|uniref:GL15468 n=1 Tax=Drosophila persimilis TaxID=7234 RepID=B4H6Q1_DROPE|nr:GL15468 [Drosophila persimilis]
MQQQENNNGSCDRTERDGAGQDRTGQEQRVKGSAPYAMGTNYARRTNGSGNANGNGNCGDNGSWSWLWLWLWL